MHLKDLQQEDRDLKDYLIGSVSADICEGIPKSLANRLIAFSPPSHEDTLDFRAWEGSLRKHDQACSHLIHVIHSQTINA